MGFLKLSWRWQDSGQGRGLWEREEMLAVPVLAPAHLEKLGCVEPAQKRDHIPLRTTVPFFPQNTLFRFWKPHAWELCGGDRVYRRASVL